MADATTQTHRDSEEVRRDIEDTRSQMDETVDALADRLSPGHLIDEAWVRLRGQGEEGLGQVVKEHPIPVALVGVGLGWLAVEQATESKQERRDVLRAHEPADVHDRALGAEASSYDPYQTYDADRYEPMDEEDESGRGVTDRVGEAATSVKEGIASAAESVRDRASDAVEGAREKARRAKERGGRGAYDESMGESLEERARRTQEKVTRGFWGTMEEHPLALGAVAFGIGLASGISVPSTRVEDRVMGRTSDALEHEAARVGRETTEKAKRVAGEAAATAMEEGGRVTDAALEAGRRRAEEEDLTAEGMKREADKVRERTAEEARKDMGVKKPDEPRR